MENRYCADCGENMGPPISCTKPILCEQCQFLQSENPGKFRGHRDTGSNFKAPQYVWPTCKMYHKDGN